MVSQRLVVIKIILVVSCLALAECRKSNALLLGAMNMMGACTTIGCRLTALETDVNQLKQQVARLSAQPMNQAPYPYQNQNQGGSNQGGLNQGGFQSGLNQGGPSQGGLNQGGSSQGGLNQGGPSQAGLNQGGQNGGQDGGRAVRASAYDYNQLIKRHNYSNGQSLRA